VDNGFAVTNALFQNWTIMKTKKGEIIPQDLAKALETTAGMREAWDKLRPSCQKDHVELVMEAKDPEMREQRIQRVLKMTIDYYQRHPEKSGSIRRKP